MYMSSNLEDWETQQEAKRAAAHKEGPLTFLAGGGAAASRREREERQVSDEFARVAHARHKKAAEPPLKALLAPVFPHEIPPLREALLTLRLSPPPQPCFRATRW